MSRSLWTQPLFLPFSLVVWCLSRKEAMTSGPSASVKRFRIVGKAVTRILKPEIQKSCGNLQVCAGIEGGCEAAIHSMREMFEDDENEAALLIDATNAFNAANRCATLHNISILCHAFYTYL